MTLDELSSYLDKKIIPTGYSISHGKYEQAGLEVIQLRIKGKGMMMHSFITNRADESTVDYVVETMVSEMESLHKARDSKWESFKRWAKRVFTW